MAAVAKPPSVRLGTLPDQMRRQILDLYRSMGGAQPEPRLAPGAWDLALADGRLVELDEEFHFTRYRAATLEADFAGHLPWASAYRTYVKQFERRAIAPGNRWASPSSIAMFGGADPVGEFFTFGSPRGKQRAIYDAMKDAAAAAGVVSLVRVSVYDSIGEATLEGVVRGRAAPNPPALAELVDRRTSQPIV
ncbi:hypothetical protein [Agrococcus sp. ProA11]|uniref:DUF7255 family protein n=1 Tax=Agrococcus chionoecetis TaxID=3153752 RepID=UPI00325FF915